MKHLVITAANVDPSQCQKKFGYDHEIRAADYLSSFHLAQRFRADFDSMTVLETVAKPGTAAFLEAGGLPVHYSACENRYKNKGINEILHLWDFVETQAREEHDVIVKLTGRYLLLGTNILNEFSDDVDMVGKDDGDLYDPRSRGVHTFLWAFRKRFLRTLVAGLDRTSPDPIEWHVKNLALKSRARILPTQSKLGVITCLYSPETHLWRRVSC